VCCDCLTCTRLQEEGTIHAVAWAPEGVFCVRAHITRTVRACVHTCIVSHVRAHARTHTRSHTPHRPAVRRHLRAHAVALGALRSAGRCACSAVCEVRSRQVFVDLSIRVVVTAVTLRAIMCHVCRHCQSPTLATVRATLSCSGVLGLTLSCNVVHSLSLSRSTCPCRSPSGRVVMLGGFGNLPGNMVRCASCVVCSLCPGEVVYRRHCTRTQEFWEPKKLKTIGDNKAHAAVRRYVMLCRERCVLCCCRQITYAEPLCVRTGAAKVVARLALLAYRSDLAARARRQRHQSARVRVCYVPT
jgi:hypothetical protein